MFQNCLHGLDGALLVDWVRRLSLGVYEQEVVYCCKGVLGFTCPSKPLKTLFVQNSSHPQCPKPKLKALTTSNLYPEA